MECYKKTFDTYSEAKRSMVILKKGIQHNGVQSGGKIPRRAYKCPECGKFHLTALKEKNRKEPPGKTRRVKWSKY